MNPYLITGPALISFSGGRTSAYMLYEILRAHDGKLPEDVHVAFANTGKEREETLRFVHECSTRWSVRVNWLERGPRGAMEIVGYNSASRAGEPFAALIREKQRLPNWKERWCTEHLKVRMLFAFAELQGWQSGGYAEVVGLRDDEGHRILRGLDRAATNGCQMRYPLAKAKVTKSVVMAFWRGQDFDLGLEPWEGNCDFCFMKGRGIKKRLIREGKASPVWWADQEREQEGFFDRRDRIVGLIEEVRQSPDMFDETPSDDEHDAECGLLCASDK